MRRTLDLEILEPREAMRGDGDTRCGPPPDSSAGRPNDEANAPCTTRATGAVAHREPLDSRTARLSFGLLPCLSDRRVHAVYDPADNYPEAVCGWNLVPDVCLHSDVLLCRRCLAALPDDAELRPAANKRHLSAPPRHAEGLLVAFERWWRARRCDRRIRRAVASEWHRG